MDEITEMIMGDWHVIPALRRMKNKCKSHNIMEEKDSFRGVFFVLLIFSPQDKDFFVVLN